MGLFIFSPGFWKYYETGHAWFFGNNLQLKLHEIWFWQPDRSPLFSLTDYPILCNLSGIGVIFFELSFIALIFFPLLRICAALGGLLFHNMTAALMGIKFFYLQICYVAFFNWHNICHRISGIFINHKMTILYDGNCELCQRTIAVLKTIDLLHHVHYVNVLEPQGRAILNEHNISEAEALKSMYVLRGNKAYEGFLAYRALAVRFPLFWPILPFLFLWPIPSLGKRIYRHIAESRHCSVKPPHSGPATIQHAALTKSNHILITGIGILLISVNIYFGVQKEVSAWPFSCYPLFSSLSKDTSSTLQINMIDQTGKEFELRTEDLIEGLSIQQYRGVMRYIGIMRKSINMKDPLERNKRLKAMWTYMAQNNEQFRNARTLRFYTVISSILPDQRHNNPLEKKLIYEWSVNTN